MKKNLSTKIISLLFAIFMWFYIIQVQDPEVERKVRDVPVNPITAELEARGLTLVNDKDVYVDVKIKGQRKYITSIKKEDIAVAADLSNISSAGTYDIRIDAKVSYGGVEVLEAKPLTVRYTVEKIDERSMPVEVVTKGKPKSGYRVGDVSTSLETVKIKGPQSILGTIDKVCVEVDVGGADKDVRASEVAIKYIGTSGEAFKPPVAVVVDGEVEDEVTVDVFCEILKEKEVDIEAVFVDSFYVLDIASTRKITIAGSEDAVKDVNSVSTKPITSADIIDGYVEVEFELPEGVEIVGADTVKLKVKKHTP